MAPCILVVEDSATIQRLLSTMLRQEGYMVRAADDGLAALELLERETVDLVLTDVNMPRMDGLTLVARLRERPALAGLPIIVLSTESGDQDRQQAIKAGANLYLTKPLPPEELVTHVRQLVVSPSEEA